MDIYRKRHLSANEAARAQGTPENSPYVSLYAMSADEHPDAEKQARIEDFILLSLPGVDQTLLEQIEKLIIPISPLILEFLVARQESETGMRCILLQLSQYPELREQWLRIYPLSPSSIAIFGCFLSDYAFAAEFVCNAKSIFNCVSDYEEALYILRQSMILVTDMLRAVGVPDAPRFPQLHYCLQQVARRPLQPEEQQLVELIFEDFNVRI